MVKGCTTFVVDKNLYHPRIGIKQELIGKKVELHVFFIKVCCSLSAKCTFLMNMYFDHIRTQGKGPNYRWRHNNFTENESYIHDD